MKQHHFVREDGRWYIDLPEFLAQGGDKADLEMISGADTMLNIIAGEKDKATLQIDIEPFESANELLLTELCDPILGGGYYHINQFENKEVNQDLWLCDVTRFVFGDIPKKIYVKRIKPLPVFGEFFRPCSGMKFVKISILPYLNYLHF